MEYISFIEYKWDLYIYIRGKFVPLPGVTKTRAGAQ